MLPELAIKYLLKSGEMLRVNFTEFGFYHLGDIDFAGLFEKF